LETSAPIPTKFCTVYAVWRGVCVVREIARHVDVRSAYVNIHLTLKTGVPVWSSVSSDHIVVIVERCGECASVCCHIPGFVVGEEPWRALGYSGVWHHGASFICRLSWSTTAPLLGRAVCYWWSDLRRWHTTVSRHCFSTLTHTHTL